MRLRLRYVPKKEQALVCYVSTLGQPSNISYADNNEIFDESITLLTLSSCKQLRVKRGQRLVIGRSTGDR